MKRISGNKYTRGRKKNVLKYWLIERNPTHYNMLTGATDLTLDIRDFSIEKPMMRHGKQSKN